MHLLFFQTTKMRLVLLCLLVLKGCKIKTTELLKYNPNFLSRESKVYLNVACYI